jgi:agmatinase
MQIDAHMDLNTDNAIFGPHFHGSNARLIMQLENVAPRNVVWVGLRGLCQREHWDFIRTSGATAFTAKQVLRDGARQVARRAAEIASRGTDGIYVSIDIDVVDIAEAPGTGAIEFGGIAALDLLAIVDELSTCEKIRAVDLMEVAPNLDPSGVTQRLGVAALLGILRERLFEEY